MEVSPIRGVAYRAKSNWSSLLDSPSDEPSIKILEVSKSDEDDAVDYYRRFNPKATSTVQQEKRDVVEGVYPEFASGVIKGVLDAVAGHLALGYFADTKSFLQEVYKESCKRKQPEELIEKENIESVDTQMKEERLRSKVCSPPSARARVNKLSLSSYRHTNTACNFMTSNLSIKTVDVESSPEVFHTPGASVSTSLFFSPVNAVTLNADEVLKKRSSKERNPSVNFDGNDEQGYTSSLNTTELRCSRAYGYPKLHNYTSSHQPNAVEDTATFHCNNEIREYCVSEQGGLNTRKRHRLPEVQHDLSLMAYDDMSMALQIPVKYKHEDAISLPCSHCGGRGIQIIPVNPTLSTLAVKSSLKPTVPDIKYFPRKTYRENI